MMGTEVNTSQHTVAMAHLTGLRTALNIVEGG